MWQAAELVIITGHYDTIDISAENLEFYPIHVSYLDHLMDIEGEDNSLLQILASFSTHIHAGLTYKISNYSSSFLIILNDFLIGYKSIALVLFIVASDLLYSGVVAPA